MAGIRSNVEMLYDSRDNLSGMIEIDIQGWTFDAPSARYNTRVIDYVVTTQIITLPGPPGEPPIQQEQTIRSQISQREASYTKDKVDEIFTLLADPIEVNESLTDQMDAYVSKAFLYVTQQDPVYRLASGAESTAGDWELRPITTTTTTTAAPTTTTTTTNGAGTTTTTTTTV